MVYDLTGDAKTALKGSINKYNRSYTTDFANRYNPLVLQSDTRNWSDCDFLPGHVDLFGARAADQPRRHRAGQRDRAEQQQPVWSDAGAPSRSEHQAAVRHRIQPEPRARTVPRRVGDRRLVPPRHLQHRAADQHARRPCRLRVVSDRRTRSTAATSVTVYNLNRAKQGLVDLLDTTATDRSKTRVNYNGLEVSFSARLPNGASMFGGWSADKIVNVSCANSDPNTLRYCDQSQYRLAVPVGLQVRRQSPAAVWCAARREPASYAGLPLAVN